MSFIRWFVDSSSSDPRFPSIFCLVRVINPSKTYWAMHLRLVRSYEVPEFGKKKEISSFECIFHDKNGERIHASAKGPTMNNMKDKMVEGNLYAIKDFIVTENHTKYRTTASKFKILFFKKTSIVEIFDSEFPRHMYQFKSFTDFAADKQIQQFELFDIIGKVISYEVPTVQSSSGRRMDVRIEDLEKNRLTCTLWEEYMDCLLPYIESESNSHVVVIIQFGRVKLFQDEIKVANTYNVTKIVVNGDATEFEDFTNRLFKDGDSETSIGTFESKTVASISDDFRSDNIIIKNLAEISHFKEDGVFWVVATIIDVETMKEWCYLACKHCSKKLIPQNDQFFCSKCNNKGMSGLYRYKLEVRVIDETENARFLMWDKECVDLIGKSATDLKLRTVEASDTFPKEIEDALSDRVGLFKIQVKADAQTRYSVLYNVLRMTADDSILSLYHGKNSKMQSDSNEIAGYQKNFKGKNVVEDGKAEEIKKMPCTVEISKGQEMRRQKLITTEK